MKKLFNNRKSKYNFFFNEASGMQYMLNHVLSHQSNQMLNDQESTLVNNVWFVLQLIKLGIRFP